MSAEEKLEKIAAWIDQEKNPDAIFECPWCAYICEILDAPSADRNIGEDLPRQCSAGL